MKNTIFASLIAMLFALSFVSCDKDDETTSTRDLCLYVNASRLNDFAATTSISFISL